MSEPLWTDRTLAEVHSRRANNPPDPWAIIARDLGDTVPRVKDAYSRARRFGRLDRVLEQSDGGTDAVARTSVPLLPGPPRVVMAGDDRPEVSGVMADAPPDADAVWAKATAEWDATQRTLIAESNQRVRFQRGPACLVALSDLHLGGRGVNYPRIRKELEIIASMPNTGAIVVGDLVDNFIGKWAGSIRFNTTITVGEEWILAKTALDMLGPKLIGVVGGNHDFWTVKAAGIDYLREIVGRLPNDILYHTDDMRFALEVGDGPPIAVRARHKWRGHSIYNVTHGQERAARWDADADVYIGAHTHPGGEVRSFSVGGKPKVAMQCGAYKADDDYAVREGFPLPGPSTAVALIITERGEMMYSQSLELTRRTMDAL